MHCCLGPSGRTVASGGTRQAGRRSSLHTWRRRAAAAAGLLLLTGTSCGPGRQPPGSTPALEQQKLRDLQAAPVAAAVVGGLDEHVQQLAYVTDNAAAVTVTLTRADVTDTTAALVQAVHAASRYGATFTSVACMGAQISVRATVSIPTSRAAASDGWRATLLLSALSTSLQAKLDIPGGMPLRAVTAPRKLQLPGNCPVQLRGPYLTPDRPGPPAILAVQ